MKSSEIKKIKKADDDHSEQQQQQKIGRIYHMDQSAEEYYGGLMQQYNQLLRLSKEQYKQRETLNRNNPSANAIGDGREQQQQQQPQGQQQQ